MKCDSCKHEKNCPAKAEYGGAKRCSAFKPQEMTNEEWLRSVSTEQLAKFIIVERKGCVYADCKNGETPYMSCKDGCDIDKLVEWLNQPHSEKE